MATKLFLLMLAATATALPAALACGVTDITVTKAGNAAKPADTTAFDLTAVKTHFKLMGPAQFARNTNSTFSCVDARGDDLYLRTPGGDYAELVGATNIFFKQTGLTPTAAEISNIFRTYMDRVATPQRPFYFHTDEGRLASLFSAVHAAGVKPKPVELPQITPKDPKIAQIWLDHLSRAEYQGCGHVRLMINMYKDYGFSNDFIARELIRQFFSYRWGTALGSAERSKINLSIKLGPLAGRAVAIVNNAGPACLGYTPLSRGASGDSSLFVYHQQAVAEYRAKVLGPLFSFIAKQPFWSRPITNFDEKKFVAAVQQQAGNQLTLTLTHLPPANAVDLFAVNYATKAA